jgi:hypothetical protein
MSYLRKENENEKPSQIVITTTETAVKKPPSFSGVGFTQDPLEFMEEFEEAPTWNNWYSHERCKELFVRCLKGHARNWATNLMGTHPEEYAKLQFDDPVDSSLVKLFKEQSVTKEWLKRYERRYETRYQLPHETPWEYMDEKRALLCKVGSFGFKRSEAQVVHEIKCGLLRNVQMFCENMECHPFHPAADGHYETYAGLETLLRWTERCMHQNLTGVVQDKQVEVNIIVRPIKHEDAKKDVINMTTLSPFEKYALNKLSKLNSLERIENDLAATMDRAQILEKRSNNTNNAVKCFNCSQMGHYCHVLTCQ